MFRGKEKGVLAPISRYARSWDLLFASGQTRDWIRTHRRISTVGDSDHMLPQPLDCRHCCLLIFRLRLGSHLEKCTFDVSLASFSPLQMNFPPKPINPRLAKPLRSDQLHPAGFSGKRTKRRVE